MRGEPKRGWTEQRHQLLASMRTGAHEPVGTSEGLAAFSARRLGWAVSIGNGQHVLTPTGRAQLAAWDGGDRTTAQQIARGHEPPPLVVEPSQLDYGALALTRGGLGGFADWLVATDQADEFLGLLIDRGVLEPSVPADSRLVAVPIVDQADVVAARHAEPCRAKFDLPEQDPRPIAGPCASGLHPCPEFPDGDGVIQDAFATVDRMLGVVEEPEAERRRRLARNPLASLGEGFTLCPRCEGRQVVQHRTCPRCEGAGRIRREVTSL